MSVSSKAAYVLAIPAGLLMLALFLALRIAGWIAALISGFCLIWAVLLGLLYFAAPSPLMWHAFVKSGLTAATFLAVVIVAQLAPLLFRAERQ